MKCQNCCRDIADTAKYCRICGAKQDIMAGCDVPAAPQYASIDVSPKHVGFGEAIKLFFRNYVNFRTRSTQSEYWFAFLFTAIVGLCCTIIDFVLPLKPCSMISGAVFFLPSLSVAFRRFHDTGRKGTLPLIKAIAVLVWKLIVSVVLLIVIAAVFGSEESKLSPLQVALAFLGAFGLGIIPLALTVWEWVVCCFDGEDKPNQYGRESRY